MLLRFTSTDMLNTSLVDPITGNSVYDIVTGLHKSCSDWEAPSRASSSNTAASPSSMSPASTESTIEHRYTCIQDAQGKVVCEITWNGRHPSITFGHERIASLSDLFGRTDIPFQPKILALPTRFDADLVWTATPESLTLYDYVTEQTRGTFYQNIFRVPATKDSFLETGIPGLGSNYLAFEDHPFASAVETIVTFIMMEILRRGRFGLTPHTFKQPKLWQLSEARSMMTRRIRRRYTV
ncbi:hypothetical protein HGRIS_012952 [Hohenbuehelia grisea]|uniref:Uncharacterized protein n=1 Tax=Hohenbuehelia grisea TaxID=104357 RepID=A0ABR3IU66_9AGAR